MENRNYLNNLFDIYKEFLTTTEKDYFRFYYIEDLTLEEIGENNNISRSSVGKTINTAVDKLKRYESILKIYQVKNELIRITKEDNIKEKIERLVRDWK